MKQTRGIDISSKLGKKANTYLLKMVHYLLFGSHLPYRCHLWGQSNIETKSKMTCLANCVLKKIFYLPLNEAAEDLCKQCKILKFRDLISFQNCSYIYRLEQNKEVAKIFTGLTHTG